MSLLKKVKLILRHYATMVHYYLDTASIFDIRIGTTKNLYNTCAFLFYSKVSGFKAYLDFVLRVPFNLGYQN